VVTLGEEAVRRAGITLATVPMKTLSAALRAPGVVEPNGYKEVIVTPLVSGRITSVTAELGQHVARGQAIARVFSPELAEAQARYISARAELGAQAQELGRTETLVGIGAASRQELERVEAQHIARRAEVQTAASRLELLGLSATAIESLGPGGPIDSVTIVPAPIPGVVTERVANVGLNVDQATKLFTVVDLSSVWVVAELYEQDLHRVRVGTPATITTAAYPGLVLQGRVSYLDPRVSPDTRTAKVRVEVPNAREELRLGMFVDARFEGEAGLSTPVVPRGAVQYIGDRTVVYLADSQQPGTFVERDVRLGAADGDHVSVLAGLQPGDVVVAAGSFSIRAERDRLGLGPASPTASPIGRSADDGEPPSARTVHRAQIIVGEHGFQPATMNLRADTPVSLTVVRTTDVTCGTEIVIPSLDIKRALPLDEPVVIEFTPEETGDVTFVCGMDMLRGVFVVQ
jgi:RND family efflux transporter MFP subunit